MLFNINGFWEDSIITDSTFVWKEALQCLKKTTFVCHQVKFNKKYKIKSTTVLFQIKLTIRFNYKFIISYHFIFENADQDMKQLEQEGKLVESSGMDIWGFCYLLRKSVCKHYSGQS